MVVDKIEFENIKTKNMVNLVKNLGAEKAYVVLEDSDKNVFMSTRNLQNVYLTTAGSLSVYDMLKYDKVILTQDVVKVIEEVFA